MEDLLHISLNIPDLFFSSAFSSIHLLCQLPTCASTDDLAGFSSQFGAKRTMMTMHSDRNPFKLKFFQKHYGLGVHSPFTPMPQKRLVGPRVEPALLVCA
jgi:hypothetical protein